MLKINSLQKFQPRIILVKSVTSSLNLISILSILSFLNSNLESKIIYTNFPKDPETDWFKGYGFVHLSSEPELSKTKKFNKKLTIPSIQSIPILIPNNQNRFKNFNSESDNFDQTDSSLTSYSSLINDSISNLIDLVPDLNHQSQIQNSNKLLKVSIENCRSPNNNNGIGSLKTLDQVTIRNQNQFKNDLELFNKFKSSLQNFGGFYGSLKNKTQKIKNTKINN